MRKAFIPDMILFDRRSGRDMEGGRGHGGQAYLVRWKQEGSAELKQLITEFRGKSYKDFPRVTHYFSKTLDTGILYNR